MSDLYKEAIADAIKLREIAEADARNSIMEKISPYIKKMIAKEASNVTSLLEEEEIVTDTMLPSTSATMGSPDLGGGAGLPVEPSSGGDAVNVPMPDGDGKITVDFEQLFTGDGSGDTVPPVDTAQVAPGEAVPPAMTEPAPVAPVGGMDPMMAAGPPPEAAVAPDMAGAPPVVDGGAMAPPAAPDQQGALQPSPEEEEEMTQPVVTEALTFAKFRSSLAEAAMKVNTAYHTVRVSDIVQESLKNRLFSLLEQLDSLVESGEISPKQGKLNEKRLEFLFLQLKEASLHNSYKTEKDKDLAMTKSLKEFAAKLFENEDQESLAMDSLSTGKTGVAVDKEMTEKGKKVSGISPEVDDLFKEESDHVGMDGGQTTDEAPGKTGSVDATALPNADGGKSQDKPWEEGEPETVSEDASGEAGKIEAEGHAGFGDSPENPVAAPDMFFEIDEQELKEAVAAIRKESAEKKDKAVVAKDKPWEKGKPEGGPDKSAEKALKKEQAMPGMGAPAAGGSMGMGSGSSGGMGGGMEEDLLMSLSLPDELEDQLDVEDLDVDLELSPEEDELGGLEGGPEGLPPDIGGGEELSVGGGPEGDLGPGAGMPPGMGGHEEAEMILTDKEDEGMDEMQMQYESKLQESRRVVAKAKQIVMEARKKAAQSAKLAETRDLEVKNLKKEMVDTNVFLAKVVYLNKFLMREGLTLKIKQQIVEHLDRAKTVAEAKDVYTKIKKKLDEVVAARSASTVVGSASKPTTAGSAKLTESATKTASSDGSSGYDPVIGTFDKWQILANIKKSED